MKLSELETMLKIELGSRLLAVTLHANNHVFVIVDGGLSQQKIRMLKNTILPLTLEATFWSAQKQ